MGRQRAVWTALRERPCGSTTSYSEPARRIGRACAVRAEGASNQNLVVKATRRLNGAPGVMLLLLCANA
jgi:O6-methylguanine-DNA--protein-cysteine methyltransferase